MPAVVPGMDAVDLKAAASGGKDVTIAKVQSTQGYTKLPTIANPTSYQDSDYYRNGKSGPNGYLPKSIDAFPDAPASIRVFGKGTGTSSSKKERDFIPAFTKFILNSTQEGHQERVQIVETFSDFYVFFYGERPPVYTYNGMLINSKNINWVADFMYYYEEHLRGTKCAENNAKLILTYGGRQVEGYILSMSTSTSADQEHGVPVSFQVVITKRNRIGFSDDFGMFIKDGSERVDTEIRKMIDAIAGKKGEGTSKKETSNAFNSASNVATGNKPASHIVGNKG